MVKLLDLYGTNPTRNLFFTIPLYFDVSEAQLFLDLFLRSCVASVCFEGGTAFLEFTRFIEVLVAAIQVSHGGIVVAFGVCLAYLLEIFITCRCLAHKATLRENSLRKHLCSNVIAIIKIGILNINQHLVCV